MGGLFLQEVLESETGMWILLLKIEQQGKYSVVLLQQSLSEMVVDLQEILLSEEMEMEVVVEVWEEQEEGEV